MGEVAGKAEGRDGEKGRWRSGQVRGGKVGMLKQGSGRSLLSTGIGNTALDQLLAPLVEPGNQGTHQGRVGKVLPPYVTPQRVLVSEGFLAVLADNHVGRGSTSGNH